MTITGPSKTFSRRPKYTFTFSETPFTIVCALDGDPVACGPLTYQPVTKLKFGSHTLEVYATDSYGNQGPTATKVFKVRRRPR